MSQKQRLIDHLKLIAPTTVKAASAASACNIPLTSCRALLSSLANTPGSGIHHTSQGYTAGPPSTEAAFAEVEVLEGQEMRWHDKYCEERKLRLAADRRVILLQEVNAAQALLIEAQANLTNHDQVELAKLEVKPLLLT